MKHLIFIILLFVGVNTYASTDSTQYVTNTNVEKLVDKYSAKLSASITSLAETLKTPAEYVYRVLVKQQKVHSISLLALCIFCLLFLIAYIKYLKWGLQPIEHGSRYCHFDDKDGLIVLAVVFGILNIVGLITVFLSIPDIIQGFMNPEYGAIKDIVEMLK